MAFDYCTAAEAFAYGNSDGSAVDPVNESAVMASVVTAVSRAIDGYCVQAFSRETYTDRLLRGVVDRDGVLSVSAGAPVVPTLSAASYRVGAALAWESLTVSDAEILEAESGATIRFLGTDLSLMRFRRVTVKATYTAGYADLAAVPRDLRWAAQALAWLAYQRRSAPMNSTAMPELGIVINPGAWPPDIKQILNRYLKVVAS